MSIGIPRKRFGVRGEVLFDEFFPCVDVEAIGNDCRDSFEERHRLRADRVRLEVVELRQFLRTQKEVRRKTLLPVFEIGIRCTTSS